MNHELSQKILTKAANAGQYIRGSILFLTLCTVISGIGCWNSLETSWLESRIKVHEDLLKWYDTICYHSSDDGVESMADAWHEFKKPLSEKQEESFDRCCEYYERYRYTKEGLEDVIADMRSARLESVILIDLPVIGAIIHINDLSVYSGIAFLVALFLVAYSYGLKYDLMKNLESVIDYVRLNKDGNLITDNTLTLIESYVRGGQVMDLPKGRPFKLVKQILPFLLVLPVAVQLSIIVHDVLTYENGAMQNPKLTIILFVIGGLLCFCNALITIFVFQMRQRANSVLTEKLELDTVDNK